MSASVWFAFGSCCPSPSSLYTGKVDAFHHYGHIKIVPEAYCFHKVICLNLVAWHVGLQDNDEGIFGGVLLKQWSLFIGNMCYSGIEKVFPKGPYWVGKVTDDQLSL